MVSDGERQFPQPCQWLQTYQWIPFCGWVATFGRRLLFISIFVYHEHATHLRYSLYRRLILNVLWCISAWTDHPSIADWTSSIFICNSTYKSSSPSIYFTDNLLLGYDNILESGFSKNGVKNGAVVNFTGVGWLFVKMAARSVRIIRYVVWPFIIASKFTVETK